MATQNLTLAIDREILLEARKFALEHGTTVNQLVRDYLSRLKDIEAARRSAREHWLNGPKVEVGPITWKREDLYGR
jgi:hypothetical protein